MIFVIDMLAFYFTTPNMKYLRKLIVPFLSLILIIPVVLWILSETISPEIIREYVSHELIAITSQPSRIMGDIKWEVFPHPGIKITNIQVGEENNTERYSLKFNNLFLNLKITPLLRGKLVFSFLKVDGFSIRINADTVLPVKHEKINSPAVTANKPLNSQFAIERLLLSNGQLTLVKNTQQIKLTGLQIGAEEINSPQASFPFQLKSQLEYSDSNRLLAKAQIQFKGSTSLSATLFTNPHLDLRAYLLNGQLIIQSVQIDKFKISKLSANTTLKNNVLSFNPLTITLYQGE